MYHKSKKVLPNLLGKTNNHVNYMYMSAIKPVPHKKILSMSGITHEFPEQLTSFINKLLCGYTSGIIFTFSLFV